MTSLLKTAETLYESRFFEALHRADIGPPGKSGLIAKRVKRQVLVRCKGLCHRHYKTPPHGPNKFWVVDFYIWPHLVVEIDGHEIKEDRDVCLKSRGLYVVHIKNEDVREIDDAVLWAGDMLARQHELTRLKRAVNVLCDREAILDFWQYSNMLGLYSSGGFDLLRKL